MARRSDTVRLFDFSGGLNTKAPVTSLAMNEFLQGQNVNLLPSGGFEKRNGNTAFNSVAMVGSTTAVHGLGYLKLSAGSEFLVATAGTSIFKSDNLDGTMDDITSSLTVTTGADKLWTNFVMNDMIIFVGGGPNAPFKYIGSGNAALLGGSPPSGTFGLTANNRAFIGLNSTIYWSILGNPEDWSGSGSGSQNVQLHDGDTIVGAEVINIDHLLIFKQNSIHDLVIRNAPFPLFPLFRNIGAVSKRAIVSVDGIIYFITPQGRMKATDGTQIIDFPDKIDDVWDGLNQSRLQYIHGIYNKYKRQIIWVVSNGTASTHDYAIVWDLARKAWLVFPKGYNMNTVTTTQSGIIYMGGYDGKIYKQDVASTYTDASESSAPINAYVRTGWMDLQQMINSKYPPYMDVSFTTQVTGNFEVSYGFDFNEDQRTEIVSMVAPGGKWDVDLWDDFDWGGQADIPRIIHMKGRGKFIQFLVRQDENNAFRFNGMEAPVKISAPSRLNI